MDTLYKSSFDYKGEFCIENELVFDISGEKGQKCPLKWDFYQFLGYKRAFFRSQVRFWYKNDHLPQHRLQETEIKGASVAGLKLDVFEQYF